MFVKALTKILSPFICDILAHLVRHYNKKISLGRLQCLQFYRYSIMYYVHLIVALLDITF